MKLKFDEILRHVAVVALACASSFIAIGTAIAPAFYPAPLV